MKQLIFTVACFALVIFTPGCKEDTFTSGRKITPSEATPKDLRYPTTVNAREYGLMKSGQPTVETGGLIPAFEITGGWDAQGQPLDATFMDKVSIITPSISDIGEYNNGDRIEVIDYKNAGLVTIAAGNPFAHGDYYFDIKVTTELKGKTYSTTFEKGCHINVGPALPSALIYIPMAQNLVIGAGKSTTNVYMPSGNPDVAFSLGSDEDKLKIDPITGAISLKEGYEPEEQVTINPTIIAKSGISGEVVTFKGGQDLITIVVSATPVDLPLQEKYFFVPTFETNNTMSGYKLYINKIGSMAQHSVWKREGPSPAAASERPASLSGNYALMNNPSVAPTVGDEPHESLLVMAPQKLSNYNYGFELSATFWIYNQYVAYLSETGQAPCELRILVSTDYDLTMSDPTKANWTDVSGKVTSRIYSGSLGESFQGVPYPGDNKLVAVNGSTGNDQAKDLKNLSRNASAKWTKCVLNLEEWKDAEYFTVAFLHKSNFTGKISYANNLNRMGRFSVSDVYYLAKEKAGN